MIKKTKKNARGDRGPVRHYDVPDCALKEGAVREGAGAWTPPMFTGAGAVVRRTADGAALWGQVGWSGLAL